MDTKIMVSVCCTAYNHEKYIKKCLDGFVMQQTDFRYEVLIHDDASTDRTADIIQEYAERYPQIIKPILQTENQYSKKINIYEKFLAPRVRGKYVALCEGDDFWIDSFKLQKQVNALQTHQDCHMCVHRVLFVTETGEKTTEIRPGNELKEGILSSRFMVEGSCPAKFQTSSYFFVAEDFKRYYSDVPEFQKVCIVGDVCWLLYFGQLGKSFYIDEIMSCYRMESEGSWSLRTKELDLKTKCRNRERMMQTFKEFDIYTNYRFHDICLDKIRFHQIRLALLTNDYKILVKKECHKQVNELNPGKKWWVKMYIGAYLPFFLKIYERKKGKLHGE